MRETERFSSPFFPSFPSFPSHLVHKGDHIMSSTNASEHETKSATRAMTEWLERQYDVPQTGAAHSGPEALAWDGHGLQAAGYQPTAAAVQA
jgi:hypothetical protein